MIKYFPDGSGVLISDSGARQAFRAGISPKDLLAMMARFLSTNAASTPPVTVVVDMNTVTQLQALVDTVQSNATASQALAVTVRSDLNAARGAVQTIQSDISAIKTKIGL
jgi:hypothetical protein